MLNRACALFVVALLALALFGPEQAFAAERCTVLDAASADARQRINDHLCFYSARPGDPAHSARVLRSERHVASCRGACVYCREYR